MKRIGCPKINLQVRTTNTQVIEFYKAIGFDVEERVSMGKRLS
jgi:ribosomal protein S18 acetylase RimI-like enzyme